MRSHGTSHISFLALCERREQEHFYSSYRHPRHTQSRPRNYSGVAKHFSWTRSLYLFLNTVSVWFTPINWGLSFESYEPLYGDPEAAAAAAAACGQEGQDAIFFLALVPGGSLRFVSPSFLLFPATLHSKTRRANFWYRSAIAGSDRIGSIQKSMAMNASLEYFLHTLLEYFSFLFFFFKHFYSIMCISAPSFPKSRNSSQSGFSLLFKTVRRIWVEKKGGIWSEKGFFAGKIGASFPSHEHTLVSHAKFHEFKNIY